MNQLNYILARLKEPSTYRGLAILGGLVGISLEPDQWTAISAAVAAVIALVEVFRREKTNQ
jgi:hypothetical protein